jgi:acyl carrier protein
MDQGASGGDYVAARTETEAKLVTIWEEILGRSPIGVQDNFFELGGHSLKATKMLSRMNSTFGVKINIKQIFTEPTIENISLHIQFILDQKTLKQNKEGLIETEI